MLEKWRCGLPSPLVRQGPRLRVSTSDSHEDPNRAGFSCEDLFFSSMLFLPSSVIPILATLTSSGRPSRPQISWYRYGWQGYVSLKVQTMILASCHVLGVIQSSWTYRTATSSRCMAGVRDARQTYRYRTDDLLSYRRRMHMRSAMWRELTCARFLTCT